MAEEERRWSPTVRFYPWIGKNYQHGVNGKQLLLVGESHYSDEPPDRDFTRRVVRSFCDRGRWKAFRIFTVGGRLIAGERWASHARCVEAWESVAFMNFLQEFAGKASRELKPGVDWNRGRAAYEEVVEVLRPDAVLFLGKRLFRMAEPSPYFGERIEHIKHPSGGMSYKEAMPVVDDLLDRPATRL